MEISTELWTSLLMDVIPYTSVIFSSLYTVFIYNSICRSSISSETLENSGLYTVLVFFSIAVVKHWPKTIWDEKIYLLYTFLSQSIIKEGRAGTQVGDKAGTIVESHLLICCPSLAQLAFLWNPGSPDQGLFLPQWSGPSHVNPENASQTCLQDNLTEVILILG